MRVAVFFTLVALFATEAEAADSQAERIKALSGEGFRGTVGSAPAVMRLQLRGEKLQGRYFYEKFGRDIDIEGTLKDGRVALRANDETFEGMRADDGKLTGVWTRAGKTQPFRFELIAREGKPQVFSKYRRETEQHPREMPRDPQGKSLVQCVREAKGAEVFGLVDPRIEAKLNAEMAAVVIDPMDCDDVDVTDEQKVSVSVRDQRWITVTRESYSYMEGAAHPDTRLSRVTFDVTTGLSGAEGIKFKRPLKEAFLVERCQHGPGDLLDETRIKTAFATPRFVLGDAGIRLIPSPANHAEAVLEGGSYDCELRFADLLKEGSLDPASPWSELWAPAGKGTSKKPAAAPKVRAPRKTRRAR